MVPPRNAAPLPSTAHLPPATMSAADPARASVSASAQQDALSVILVTTGYDNTIRFWEAWSGYSPKKINHPEHVSCCCPGVLCPRLTDSVCAGQQACHLA